MGGGVPSESEGLTNCPLFLKSLVLFFSFRGQGHDLFFLWFFFVAIPVAWDLPGCLCSSGFFHLYPCLICFTCLEKDGG